MQIVDSRIETSENNLKTVQQGLAEKDTYIVKLEEKIKVLENKFEKFAQNEEERIKLLEDKVKVTEQDMNTKRDKPSKCTLKSSECDFIGSTQNGLKVHKAKKHTAISENKSTMCEVCGESFKNGTELRKHSKSHLY